MKYYYKSFCHAIEGLLYCLKTQPNFQLASLFAILVTLASWYFHIGHTQFLLVLFSIALVMVTELLNTAIESVTNLITERHHDYAKITKDVSAGMVLLSVIFALVVGLVTFLPHIRALFFKF